ncbi:hypothetical protein SAMN04489751_4018 [Brevibacterium sandarakinum]|uniref:DUF3592 domain-containing protein n=1 Tax=Brevibacterium sandarakinum TaxID=629680 RepID=A0A1H1YAG0_BRESA|nr:hypothetical protein [Brevibacterium sandarakinum]SDT17996.1 hypothetical protein SAMN04489751_4018 [Brevibacterium sandarakinum]
MKILARGSQLGLVLLLAILLIGFTVALAITALWPQALLAGIVIACCTAIFVMIGMVRVVGRRWVLWLAVPAVALAGLAAVMLAEDLGVSRTGELTEVVIVDHTVDVHTSHNTSSREEREAYTHEYILEHPDGTPIEKPMIYRGEDGYDDFDTGDTITAFIDPEGNSPTEPAENVNIGADIAILIVGLVAVIGVFGMCSLLLLLRDTRRA